MVSTTAVRAPQCTGPGRGLNTNLSVGVCVCATACLRPHMSFYVLQYPPLNVSNASNTHTRTHRWTHTHEQSCLALRSSLVVCAANVYDLNQANPTGLFQWIENDLQDAAAWPTRGSLRNFHGCMSNQSVIRRARVTVGSHKSWWKQHKLSQKNSFFTYLFIFKTPFVWIDFFTDTSFWSMTV